LIRKARPSGFWVCGLAAKSGHSLAQPTAMLDTLANVRNKSEAEVLAFQSDVSFGSHSRHCSTDRQEGRSCRRAFQFRLQGMPVIHPLIVPDGQITESCPAPFAKIFSFSPDPNQQYIAHRPVPQRGARAIVTDAGRDAMDADSAARRPALEVDGEVVWS
jgi:hypothetical protein